MSTIVAKDLAKEFPRSPFEDLGGMPWLARLIDKVRALDAGTLGEYTPFPCGGDRNFLMTLGVEADALKQVISGGASDAEIAEWVKAHWTPGAEERIAGYRAGQREAVTGDYLTYLEGAKAELAKSRPELDLSKITNFAELICVEEGYPVPHW